MATHPDPHPPEQPAQDVAIVGCRKYENYDRFSGYVDGWSKEHGPITCVVSGGAPGVDTMAERYAREHEIPATVLRPDWDRVGKMAGLMRNTDIVALCDAMIAFPSGHSRGTWDSVRKAKRAGKSVTVYHI